MSRRFIRPISAVIFSAFKDFLSIICILINNTGSLFPPFPRRILSPYESRRVDSPLGELELMEGSTMLRAPVEKVRTPSANCWSVLHYWLAYPKKQHGKNFIWL